jgi:hypothetical protein
MPASHNRGDVLVELNEYQCREVFDVLTGTNACGIECLDDCREVWLRIGPAPKLTQKGRRKAYRFETLSANIADDDPNAPGCFKRVVKIPANLCFP